ncbi:hypothetical protein EV424DRAFT_987120 [Suillus variegatus]|nr:hypothetical protein EV424DRAFT_987120 [Suillus variegatus]
MATLRTLRIVLILRQAVYAQPTIPKSLAFMNVSNSRIIGHPSSDTLLLLSLMRQSHCVASYSSFHRSVECGISAVGLRSRHAARVLPGATVININEFVVRTYPSRSVLYSNSRATREDGNRLLRGP